MIVFGLILLALAVFGAPLFALIAASALFSYYREDIELSALAIEFFSLPRCRYCSRFPCSPLPAIC
jgi:hypothetical protein